MTTYRVRTLTLTIIWSTFLYGCNPTDTGFESLSRSLTLNTSQTDPCTPPTNPIACENSKPGNPPSEWDIVGSGDPSIQGFATDISVNRGKTVHFKIKTDATKYHLDIYRVGYYAGQGARFVASIRPSARLPQIQPDCLQEADTLLVDCGNWKKSASWAVPSNATSGVYLAKLKRSDTSGASHIIFVVRDDTGGSDILFQTSDTTWQAYNTYGGYALYPGGSGGNAATKVSYNRPFINRGGDGVQGSTTSFFFSAEYPMIRWLEANGYDVSYFTGVDTDRMGTRILSHKVFLSVGHDEYWSAQQRANVEAARAARVHLAFFSGNEMFWKTRWESSIDSANTLYRTLVCYKETYADVFPGRRTDPNPAWTGTWRDPSFSPPSDGGRPANALTGTNFMVQVDFRAMTVPPADGKMRLWRNTSVKEASDMGTTYELKTVCTCTPGQYCHCPSGICSCTLGPEWDEDSDNGFRPPGIIRASSTYAPAGSAPPGSFEYLLDHGLTYSAFHDATHHVTLHRDPPTLSGALVFGAGTINWSWGLDSHHDFDPAFEPRAQSSTELAMQQATVNLFADMCDATGQHCIQPRTLQPGLVRATASTDSEPPTSVITSPSNGGTVVIGSPVSITGTAVDSGGGVVGGVEVSVDGGLRWHPANDRSWSYSWKPTRLGSTTIQSRAVDDTGNLETPVRSVNVTVVPRSSEILMFYNRANGSNAIGTLSDTGSYVDLSNGLFAAGWTHIVTGVNSVLFFYRSTDGYSWTGKLDDAGNYMDVGQVTYSPEPQWTHVVAGANNILWFYNSATGKLMLGKLDDEGDFAPLSTRTLPAGYTNIVAGVNNVFLFYDSKTGRAATAKLAAPAGNYVDLQQITGLSTGWTHIVAGVNNVFLFFNAGPGNAMSARLNDDGSITTLKNPLWSADLGWTTIAAGVKNNTLLFYHSPSGTVATRTLDASGNYVHLLNHTGFSPGWTHIIGP